VEVTRIETRIVLLSICITPLSSVHYFVIQTNSLLVFKNYKQHGFILTSKVF